MSGAVSAPTEEHVRRLGAVVVLLCATSATLVLAPGGTGAAERHAGTVVAVDPTAETLVIDELVANGTPRSLRVRLGPQARITLSERNDKVEDLEHVFSDTTLTLAEIRPGDFVVVELAESGKQKTVATAVTVTLRAATKVGR